MFYLTKGVSFVLNDIIKHVFKSIFPHCYLSIFYPTVSNCNRNKHIKLIVNRSAVIGTLYIQFIWLFCVSLWYIPFNGQNTRWMTTVMTVKKT